MAICTRLSSKAEREWLAGTLQDLDTIDEDLPASERAWRRGDVRRAEKLREIAGLQV